MTDTNQLSSENPLAGSLPQNPSAILVAATGLGSTEQVQAMIVANRQQIMDLGKYNQVLQVNRQPVADARDRKLQQAGSFAVAALFVAPAAPILAKGLAIVALDKGLSAVPAAMQTARYDREIRSNNTEIGRDAAMNETAQAALATAAFAAQQVEAAKQQQAAQQQAAQFKIRPAGMS